MRPGFKDWIRQVFHFIKTKFEANLFYHIFSKPVIARQRDEKIFLASIYIEKFRNLTQIFSNHVVYEQNIFSSLDTK